MSKYEPIYDDVLGKYFDPCCMRSCPEPHVIKRYGTGNQANVSVYVCRKCRYHQSVKWIGGSKCTYETETLNG